MQWCGKSLVVYMLCAVQNETELYRVSQEECEILRESFPYVKENLIVQTETT